MISCTNETGLALTASPHPVTGNIRVSVRHAGDWYYVFIDPTNAADWAEGLLEMAEGLEGTA